MPFEIAFSGKRHGKKVREINLNSSVFKSESFSERDVKNTAVMVIVFGHHFHAPLNDFVGPRTSNIIEAFRMSVKTAVKDMINLNFRFPIIWVSYSPSHFKDGWNMGGNCDRYTSPSKVPVIFKQHGYSAQDWNMALQDGLRGAPSYHHYFDIITLSYFRVGAHPNKMILKSRQDCVHWCLPGVADTWNEILFSSFLPFLR